MRSDLSPLPPSGQPSGPPTASGVRHIQYVQILNLLPADLLHRKGEPVRGRGPEAQESGPEVVSVPRGRAVLELHGEEAELSPSGTAGWELTGG